MPKYSPIAESHSRCQFLAAIVENAKSAAQSDPTHEKWKRHGLVSEGDSKKEAVQKINYAFDALTGMIAHLSILDMAAAFERASRARLENSIDETKKAHRSSTDQIPLPSYSIGFLRNLQDFGSLNSIISLMNGHIGSDLIIHMKAIRDARNNYAHGTDIRAPPAISGDDAHDYLSEILELL